VDLNELVKILLHDETKKEICGGEITRPCSSSQNSTNSNKTIKKNHVYNENQYKG
jgi:hypothetical protein